MTPQGVSLSDESPSTRGIILVVLGMHRSGTSALARALNSAGWELPNVEHVLGPGRGNSYGHFEDARVVRINDHLLAQHRATHDSPWNALIDLEWSSDPERSSETTGDGSVFGDVERRGAVVVKDPRMCLTLPWWDARWPKGREVQYLAIHRHPVEVAASLNARDGMPETLGEAIWVAYEYALLSNLQGQSVTHVLHDDLLRSPDQVARVMPSPERRSHLGVVEAGAFVRAIDPTQRHHVSTQRAKLSATNELWDAVQAGSVGGDESQRWLETLFHEARMVAMEWERADASMAALQVERDALLAETEALFIERDRLSLERDAVLKSRTWRWASPWRRIRAML